MGKKNKKSNKKRIEKKIKNKKQSKKRRKKNKIKKIGEERKRQISEEKKRQSNGYHHQQTHMNGNGNIINKTNGYGKSNKIEYEIKKNIKMNVNDNNKDNDNNDHSCPCCDNLHNMDDNISTHLTEISKLYNLNDAKDWKKFLLLPLHKK